ncbi:MAG: hypothetical protein UZ19_OD1000812 [Parcubacteria bacterium OLB19]|nr:MAG: hypothetical protein UZ19_OD1000812 [Parcubacteria bacterium OLB19]
MKTIKNTIATFLMLALIVPVSLLVATPKAEAACSYQGFLSSDGKCANSYLNTNGYLRDNNNDYRPYDYNYNYNYNYDYNYGNCSGGNCYNSQIEHLRAIITHLQAIIASLQSGGGNTGGSEINVTTLYATNVDDDSAKLRGEIDFNNSDTAKVWFQYGESRSDLDERTTKIELDDSDSSLFNSTVTSLDDGTIYYFRAVGEDEDGEVDYGSILSFRTVGDYFPSLDDEPKVTTDEADDVTENSASLQGTVDMNDFDDGKVFFVYGEDEDLIDDIERDFDTYKDIDEEGDDLQKVLMDSSLDGDDDYTLGVYDLDDNTEYFFNLCVEYEDEDNDDKLKCGDVENFETDEN